MTEKHLQRLIEFGLLEEFTDHEGKDWLVVVDWRDLRPLEWTGAQRKQRWRERHGMYGRRKRRPGDPEVAT